MPCLQLHSNETDYFFEHKEFPVKVEKKLIHTKKAINKAFSASFTTFLKDLFFDIKFFLILGEERFELRFVEIVYFPFCARL